MNKDQAKELLLALGAKNIHPGTPWTKCSCPLSPWTHTHGHDHNPSFGLLTKPGEPPRFNCFTCQSGSAEELIGALEYYQGKSPISGYLPNFVKARELLELINSEVVHLPPFSEFPPTEEEFQQWPLYWLDEFPYVDSFPEAMEYLLSREVLHSQIKDFDLRYDPERRMVLFPYYNVYGKFAGVRGRSIDLEPKLKHFDYRWNGVNNAKFCWFNEPCLQSSAGPLVVVEGQFDLLRVHVHWKKVVANMTAKVTDLKLKRVAQEQHIIQFPDRDATGEASVERYQSFCGQNGIRYTRIALPAGVKDPGETHPDFLMDQITKVI